MNMPQTQITERQHYLPSVYLKQFSVDGANARRESIIWRLDQRIHKPVPVHTQCHERFFYSATAPNDAETFFWESEQLFGEIAKRIWKRAPSRGIRDYFGLLILMMSIHLRNPAYRIDLPQSRLDAYKLLEQQAAIHILLRGPTEAPSEAELLEVIKRKWRVRLLLNADSAPELLITSDNPSVWFSMNDSGDVHYILLPITPWCCAVAFDCTALTVEGTFITAEEVSTLNMIQAKSMLKAIYGSRPFPAEDQEAAPEWWSRREPPSGFINAEEWKLNVLPHRGALTFIRQHS